MPRPRSASAAPAKARSKTKAPAKAKTKAPAKAKTKAPAKAKTTAKAKTRADVGSKSTRRSDVGQPERGRAPRVVLLTGGNPQIAKAEGDAPVQAYIAGMPGWKRQLGERLDALIVRSVPHVKKAVKWNSPLYGIEGQGWFLGIHSFTRYVKLAFFRGASLRPLPPEASKDAHTRYVNIHEHDELDEAQLARWVKQAAELPGWVP
ncbi:MAG: DUF1801 domain-containing protein [Myxococcales bacterium]